MLSRILINLSFTGVCFQQTPYNGFLLSGSILSRYGIFVILFLANTGLLDIIADWF